jgi:GT2 family glycosyltransferase
MGVNFSLSRAAFKEVNGYDHEWEAPFREDRDLDLRLNRAGFRCIPLLNRAIVYHLYHGERSPVEEFERRVLEEVASERVRCQVGLDSNFD